MKAARVFDDGGAGALGWPSLVLLPLLAWRRFGRRSRVSVESPSVTGEG